jgi:hypothetical protein
MGKKMNIAFLVSGGSGHAWICNLLCGTRRNIGDLYSSVNLSPEPVQSTSVFRSYNIEMVEITGGRFWKPYASKADASPAVSKQPSSNQPAGVDPSLFQFRSPIDLSNSRLRKLAAALGPVYLRVSGTWQTLHSSRIQTVQR